MYALDAALNGYSRKRPYGHLRTYFTTNHDENSWNGTEYEKYGNMALPLAVFSSMWKGIPLIYSGQELPNQKRLLFFDKDEIVWKGKPALHDFYKKLLNLRKTHPVFQTAYHQVLTWRISTTDNHSVFAFARTNLSHHLVVLLNFSDQRVRIQLDDQRLKGSYTDLFSGKTVTLKDLHTIDPWGYIVLG